jgi:hypothetical protein
MGLHVSVSYLIIANSKQWPNSYICCFKFGTKLLHNALLDTALAFFLASNIFPGNRF